MKKSALSLENDIVESEKTILLASNEFLEKSSIISSLVLLQSTAHIAEKTLKEYSSSGCSGCVKVISQRRTILASSVVKVSIKHDDGK